MSNPSMDHFKALDRIWQYLIGTKNHGLYYRVIYNLKPNLLGYSDSDWGGDYNTRRSTTGYVFTYRSVAISWNSRLQKTIALLSCEAEYMALKETIKEHLWLKLLFKQIRQLLEDKEYNNTLYIDSQSAIELSKNLEHHSRTKHIDIQYHFVRENTLNGNINLKYIQLSN